MCFGVTSKKSNKDWYIDSAATCHMCCDENYFVNLNKQKTDSVYLADGTELNASGSGECQLVCQNKTFHIKDVLYIPQFLKLIQSY